MLNRRTAVTFVIGLVLGLILAVVARPFLGRRLPEAVTGKREMLAGPVTAKQRSGDRLLLTIDTPAGASLATFEKRVDEIDLLIQAGDSVTVAVPQYRPFLEDPEIARVAKSRAMGRQEPGGHQLPDTTPPPAPEPTNEPGDTLTGEATSSWY